MNAPSPAFIERTRLRDTIPGPRKVIRAERVPDSVSLEELERRDMGNRRAGETEAELVDRRGREAEERFRAHVASFPPESERTAASVAGGYSAQDVANGRIG